MARIYTRQPAVAKPVRVIAQGLGTAWAPLAEANDYSVPDPNRRWYDSRDPTDIDRRIVPGVVLLEAPLMMHNTSANTVTVEISIVPEFGGRIHQAVIPVPGFDTYVHPLPGQRLLKYDIASARGDRLEAKASTPDVIDVTASATEGSAEQHQPRQIT